MSFPICRVGFHSSSSMSSPPTTSSSKDSGREHSTHRPVKRGTKQERSVARRNPSHNLDEKETAKLETEKPEKLQLQAAKHFVFQTHVVQVLYQGLSRNHSGSHIIRAVTYRAWSVSRVIVTGTRLLCKTEPLNGYKLIRVKNRRFTGSNGGLQEFLESNASPKVIKTDNSLEFGENP